MAKKTPKTCTLETSQCNKRREKDILHQSIGADRIFCAETAKYTTFKEQLDLCRGKTLVRAEARYINRPVLEG